MPLWTYIHMKHSTVVMKILDSSAGWLFPMFQATHRTQESVDCERKVYAAPIEACTHMKHSTMVMKMLDPSPGWMFPVFQATHRTQESVDCKLRCERCTQYWLIYSSLVMKSLAQLGITYRNQTLTYANTYEGRSEINASYFIMLAHDVRGEYCWYGSRGWTFPPIFR